MSVSPPRPKGPHLNALRAFEAAARLGSFTAASQELCVTPGAIAQHIKSLEAWAKVPLFIRNTRGVVLTPLGEELLPGFTIAFDHLGEAVQSLRTKAAPDKITIATLPAIAQLWLPEKLGELREAAPEISVSVIASETAPNLSREPIDIALFFEDGLLEEGDIEIFQDRIFPVCTPQISARLQTITDLAHETLLHDSTWTNDWHLWLASVAQHDKFPVGGPTHSLFAVALEEARHGAGVLIAHEALLASSLKTGALVVPFDHKVVLKRRLVMRTTSAFAAATKMELLRSIFCK